LIVAPSLLSSGDLWIEQDFVPHSQALFELLLKSIIWDDRMKARKAASFGLPYNYSGITYAPTPWPDSLLPLLDRLERRLGYQPNNCLAHYYADGSFTMGFHSDSTAELVPGTGIAVVSLGAERAITFRHQADRKRVESYPLPSGLLLYMSLAMQQDWKHAILTVEGVGQPISLTFRRMKAE
jgi:alkylated DNA repair dioxygenase AlkB